MKNEIALGITDDQVALGSHLVHFWQNEEEFENGVRFSRARNQQRIPVLRSVWTR
jgi:hypothetical protein